MKIFFFNALPILLIGAGIGNGPFGLSDWQWWAWIVPIALSLVIRDELRKQK